MKHNLNTYKGIHPGKIIDRRLKKLNLSQRAFARDIGEHSQSINAVITGRRPLTTELSIKVERALDFEEGFLLVLQAYYNIAEYKRKEASASVTGVPNIRKMLFWDTDFEKIDWGHYRKAVIQRVFERGNEAEKEEIIRFYGIQPSEIGNYKPTNSYRIRAYTK
ncbi:addiction module HigA family antidote [Parabacteroides sp. PFB2-10]|uniref:HigA family addiction module antitoxin n=1 Tax=Parabacteroides sp. PFB2-10 TaxID=1742405 RepID=UPI002474105A|nr:HigA family addiction module antitoxin [Parabacteroides sp. PFB2-10]MDH6314250.1 addiction module HigA family antidote [Parabacteroides sp. PFB2-10]MDL2244277.1 HigA family addiction module antidote protein [Parabacteroides sp. OttesenSCG-928-J18]